MVLAEIVYGPPADVGGSCAENRQFSKRGKPLGVMTTGITSWTYLGL